MTICPHPDDAVPTFNCVLKTVENINTAKSLQKSRKQFASRRKRSPKLNPSSYLDYMSIRMHLFAFYPIM